MFCLTLESKKHLEAFEFCSLFCRFLLDFELAGWLVAVEQAN